MKGAFPNYRANPKSRGLKSSPTFVFLCKTAEMFGNRKPRLRIPAITSGDSDAHESEPKALECVFFKAAEGLLKCSKSEILTFGWKFFQRGTLTQPPKGRTRQPGGPIPTVRGAHCGIALECISMCVICRERVRIVAQLQVLEIPTRSIGPEIC